MASFKKYKTIFLVIIAVVVTGVAYNMFFKKENNRNLLVSDTGLIGSDSQASLVGDDLLTLLLDIRSVKLDDDIFSRESFKSLEDFSQSITPEPVGRKNPFAPVGFVASPSVADVVDGSAE